MEVQQVKQRFGIIGNAPLLNRALEVAIQVAPTDISVLVTGESGTGKEIIPQVIHQLSSRKHGEYIAVNCGAIPEGTIDPELFGHEKGSFTGANKDRAGKFEAANGGTIFLDEIGDMSLSAQAKVLRALQESKISRVGSDKDIKVNVRIVAATNKNLKEEISEGRFREDLFYRLSTVPIPLPPLRKRQDDIHLIFRKFASDFADKYRMPGIKLTDEAITMLKGYSWPGNIRQLKNMVEQISVIETAREIDAQTFINYIPSERDNTPALINDSKESINERELMYKFLFDMKKDLTDLKKLVLELVSSDGDVDLNSDQENMVSRFYQDIQPSNSPKMLPPSPTDKSGFYSEKEEENDSYEVHEEVEESLSLEDTERELIKKALTKHKGKRKYAASELGISERTLYRKIKEYSIND